MVALAAAGLVAAAVTGCGGAGKAPVTFTATPAKPHVRRRPVLCGRLRARILGHVNAAAATELSGLVLSQTQPGVLWTHNDSSDRPRVFAVASDGRLLATLDVSGAQAFDWEDIADSRDGLLIGDIGDNLAQRPSISVYRVAEASVTSSGAGAVTRTAPASRIELRYPDGPRDAETLLRDPGSGALVIVAKSYGETAGVYVDDHPTAGGAVTTLRRTGTLRALGAITAGDVSADGRVVALRSYDRAYIWARRRGESLAGVLRRKPCSPPIHLFVEGQGESLALDRAGDAFYTVPEGKRPAIRRYAPR